MRYLSAKQRFIGMFRKNRKENVMRNLHSALPLQLFAEATENTGVSAPVAGVQGVKQEADAAQLPEITASADPDAEFDRLIRGQFKDQYNARVQDIVRKRLKNQEKTLEQYRALEPSLELLAKKYGIEAKDPQALAQAIQAQEQSHREDEDLPRELERRADAKRQYEQWMWQAQQARALYPNLDLSREVHNPRFMELLSAGVPVGDAYLVAHRDEIIPAAMRYTAKAVEEKLANRIAANGARPTESAMATSGTAVVADQVAHMSRAQRQDIIRRVQRGEIIKF